MRAVLATPGPEPRRAGLRMFQLGATAVPAASPYTLPRPAAVTVTTRKG